MQKEKALTLQSNVHLRKRSVVYVMLEVTKITFCFYRHFCVAHEMLEAEESGFVLCLVDTRQNVILLVLVAKGLLPFLNIFDVRKENL